MSFARHEQNSIGQAEALENHSLDRSAIRAPPPKASGFSKKTISTLSN